MELPPHYYTRVLLPKREGGLSRLSGSKRQIVHPSGGALRFGLLGGLLLGELSEISSVCSPCIGAGWRTAPGVPRG